jgi:riboflavin synthase
MFTGIIIAVGTVVNIEAMQGDTRITIDVGNMNMADVKAGDSISVNGACLTVVAFTATSFCVDVSVETLACTTLGMLKPGSRVNLEKALKIGDRLDGHFVSGHIDATGTVMAIMDAARSREYQIEAPSALSAYLCRKGSICVDGVSLTINTVTDSTFSINVIPHTLAHTVFKQYTPGSKVNLEVDIIARYLQGLLHNRE